MIDPERPFAASGAITARLRLVGYASGNFGKNLLWGGADLTLLFFLTEVVGIAAATAGTMILVSLLINAALDPLIGALADRVRGPLGAKVPFVLIGGPLCGAAFALLFSLPALGLTDIPTTMVALILFRVGYSVMDAPHNALLTDVAGDAHAQSAVTAVRFVFSSLATVAVIFILPSLIAASDDDHYRMLARVAVAAGALSAAVMVGSALSARRHDPATGSWHLVRHAVTRRAVASPLLLRVLAIALVLSVGVPLFPRMILFYATDVVGNPAQAGHMLAALVTGQMIGVVSWTILARARSIRTAMLAVTWSLTGCGAGALLMGHGIAGDLAISVAFGIASSGFYSLIWVLAADCTNRLERASGRRTPVYIFSMLIVAMKLGQGLGAGFSGWLMSAADYGSRAETAGNAEWVIGIQQSGVPLLIGLLAAFLLRRYPGNPAVGEHRR